ncbi:hypothetical protein EYF80_005077 [Liparis tanakae]|uniref:Uncharacterized protein n=1 Tax=Liparis tanakae TaxID=230148 RepID=A0A4Z2J5A0_9TELE|nr:hypothetical protein EYF80_005077 [Liparis tanakae]
MQGILIGSIGPECVLRWSYVLTPCLCFLQPGLLPNGPASCLKGLASLVRPPASVALTPAVALLKPSLSLCT